MPPKPKPTRVNRVGRVVPNEVATAAGGALNERSVQRRDFAIAALLDDIEAKQPTLNRYVRVRTRIMTELSCSRTSAERAIRAAKLHLAERFDVALPARRAEVCEQLQRIADRQEEDHPLAAVAALREEAKILGLYAPKKLEVTHGTTPELALQLDAILAILDGVGQAALDVVLGQIEAAKRDGRLALPAGDEEQGGEAAAEDPDDTEDAELIDDAPSGTGGGDPPAGEPGAN